MANQCVVRLVKAPGQTFLVNQGSLALGTQRGRESFFGQRLALWEAAYPKTTPDPFRSIPSRNT